MRRIHFENQINFTAVTDLEFAMILFPFHFAPTEVEPGPTTQ